MSAPPETAGVWQGGRPAPSRTSGTPSFATTFPARRIRTTLIAYTISRLPFVALMHLAAHVGNRGGEPQRRRSLTTKFSRPEFGVLPSFSPSSHTSLLSRVPFRHSFPTVGASRLRSPCYTSLPQPIRLLRAGLKPCMATAGSVLDGLRCS